MSLTRIGSIGINTGIAFAGVTTIVTLNTANDALSIGATVNVGSGITLGASGDIFATGVSTVTTLKVGSGVTVSSDGDIFATGVTTATTFSGSGANLTNLPAANLTGTLPAISGANLTNLDASDLASGTVPTARLGSGTASSSTFLRGDSTFQTVNTDLVSDTSPQLGGNLSSNGNNINIADSTDGSTNRITVGSAGDLQIYHDSNDSYIHDAGTGHLNILATNFRVRNADSDEVYIVANDDGAVELYHDNTLRFETTSSGTRTTGAVHVNDGSTTGNRISVGNGGDLKIYHTNPGSYIDDDSLALTISSQRIDLASDDGENMARFYKDAQVELYHNNIKKFDTVTNGVRVHGSEGGDAELLFLADEGDDNADFWRFLAGTAGQLDVANYSTGSWVNHMTIDGNGVMTRPKTPSFSAHTTNTTSANSDVVFNAAVTAIGSHYSTSTGRFTAPVAGNYYFSFYGMAPHADSTNIRCYFKINGAAHSSGQMYGGVGYAGGTPTNGYTHISMDTVLPLSANDYVNVYWQNTSMHSEHCKFNGFLIG